MPLTLDLPNELETRLSAEAMRLGMPLQQYALRLLGDTPEASGQLSNGAELVAFWKREGVIGSRSDIDDGQAHARRIRQQAERRPRD